MMEVPEIIEAIRYETGEFALDAVQAAIARREEVTPALLAILEEVAERGAALNASGDYIAPFYAMFLLGQFRETRAYPIVVRIALLPGDVLDRLFDDFVTAGLGSVLASVCGGDLTGIKSIVENVTADQWARGAALDSLVTLYNCSLLSREEVVEYFRQLLSGKLARTEENVPVLTQVVACADELYPEQLLEEIERAFADDLIDSTFVGMNDIRRSIAKGRDQVLAWLAEDPNHQLVNDTIREFGSWACFEKDQEDDDFEKQDDDEDLGDDFDALDILTEPGPWNRLAPLTYRRETPKIGRNEPCPCGSGKKYKKCCGA